MARRHNPLADRLARLENANRAHLWSFTLDDGSTGSLPIGAVLDAISDALTRIDQPHVDHAPVSAELRLLARVADGSETSMLGRTAIELARQAVEDADSTGAQKPRAGRRRRHEVGE